MIYKIRCCNCDQVIEVETDLPKATRAWCVEHSGIEKPVALQDPPADELPAVACVVQLDLFAGA